MQAAFSYIMGLSFTDKPDYKLIRLLITPSEPKMELRNIMPIKPNRNEERVEVKKGEENFGKGMDEHKDFLMIKKH